MHNPKFAIFTTFKCALQWHCDIHNDGRLSPPPMAGTFSPPPMETPYPMINSLFPVSCHPLLTSNSPSVPVNLPGVPPGRSGGGRDGHPCLGHIAEHRACSGLEHRCSPAARRSVCLLTRWWAPGLFLPFGCCYYLKKWFLFRNYKEREERGERERERNTLICCSTHWCIHWLILACALTGD